MSVLLISGKSYHFFKWKFPRENTEFHIIQVTCAYRGYRNRIKSETNMGEGRKNEKNTHTRTRSHQHLKVNRNKWIQYSFRWFFDIRFNLPGCLCVCTRKVCVLVYTWFCVHLTHWTNWCNKNVISTKWNRKFLLDAFSHTYAQLPLSLAILVHCLKNLISGTRKRESEREREMLSQFVLSLEK